MEAEGRKRIKLLIIAGGGVFGMVPARFLLEVEDLMSNQPITHFSGTSIGGIEALYLATGKCPSQLFTDFKGCVGEIFRPRPIKRVMPLWKGPKYDASGIERFLKDCLPGKMKDLQHKVVIPAINFKVEVPRIFHNLEGSIDLNYDTWKVGRATSAAPYYFDPFGQDIMIDGGLLENVPLMTAVTKLKAKEGVRFEDMDIFILGTGSKDVKMDKTLKEVKGYWPWQWGTKMLLPFSTRANEMASEHWGKDIGFHYFRYYNPIVIDGNMDDPSLVTSGLLEECCDLYLGDFRTEFCKFLNA
jgi:patatin-like phospholipase/acyl hydrolase